MKGLLNTIVKIIFSITIIVIWLVVPILADSQVDISPITLAAIGAIVYCKNKHKNNERTSDSYSRYLDDILKNK